MEISPTSDSRKRLVSTTSNQNPCKRSRSNDTNCHFQNIVPVETSQCSIEAMLSVPLEVIFRDSPPTSLLSMTQHQQQQRNKPLLTRVEAQTLIRTSQLAFEIDVLVQLTSDVLSDKVWCRSMSENLERKKNPFLKSLLPLLAVHGEVVPNAAIRTFQHKLDNVMAEMERCVLALRQYSEQNWTVAESLMDALGYQLDDVDDGGAAVSPLATEKRILGDIEEELCRRIEALLGIAPVAREGIRSNQEDDVLDLDFKTSMAEFCNRSFGPEKPAPISLLRDACAAEAIGLKKDKAMSKGYMVVESPPTKMIGNGDTAVTSSPDDEPTEQESFEPSQERNLSLSNTNEKKKRQSLGRGMDPESSTQSAAAALAVMFAGGHGKP